MLMLMFMVEDIDTRSGTHTHMGKARVSCDICMGQPICVWTTHTLTDRSHAYGTAYTCMGKILTWDGTIITSTLPISIACDDAFKASLVRKILCPVLKISLLVCTSHPVWHTHFSIATLIIILGGSKASLKIGYSIILVKLQDQCCK